VKTKWSVGELLATSTAYWRACTLQAAVKIGVFSTIHSRRLRLDDIASEINADARGTEFLLDALAAMGLLKKTAGIYSNSEEALEYLCSTSPKYIGHIILHHHHILDGWAQLHDAVKLGHPVDMRSHGEDVERESFLMGMFNLAMGIAPRLSSEIDLKGRRHLLDLGGGPGTYAIHFCLANPHLTAVVYDRPTTEPFARRTLNGFNLTDRVTFIGGDFSSDPISGGPYDVAWLSHILHSLGQEECQTLINKTVAALQPGGLLLIHEFILDNAKDGPEFPALFSLNMLIHNHNGRSYSEAELHNMLTNAGVTDVARHSFQGPNDSAIIYGVV